MVRSRYWLETIHQASQEGALTLEEISLDRLNYKRTMVSVKKNEKCVLRETIKEVWICNSPI